MTAPTSRRTASSTTPATWRSCARGSRRRRSCSPQRRRRSRPGSTRRRGRYGWLRLPSRFGAGDPAAAHDRRSQARRPAARPLAVAEGDRRRRSGARARRAGAPFPQPARLCAAHALPACGHRFECPNCSAWLVEHRFRAALVCHHCGHVEGRPKLCPACHEADSLTACGPGVERLAEEAAAPLSRHPHADAVVRFSGRDRDAETAARRGGERRIRPRHRHPARRQGPQFSAADLRLRCRRRCRPRQRRSARRRAHLPAPAPGDRAGRTRRTGGPRAAADLAAGPSGDRRRWSRATPSASTGRRRSSGGSAACRRSGAWPRSSSRPRTRARRRRTPARSPAPPMASAEARPGGSPRSAASRGPTRSSCSARPRRRSRF